MRHVARIAAAVAVCFGLVWSGSAASAAYPRGIDVSAFQGTIDWDKVAASGRVFAILRATRSNSEIDTQFDTNRAGADDAGVLSGAYHVAYPNGSDDATIVADATAEAQLFLTTVGPLPSEIRPVLDLERHGDLTADELELWASTWLATVEDEVGVRPIIYSYPNFWQTRMADTQAFTDHPLWIAHYDVASPLVPAGNWGGEGWTLWQHTNEGATPGIIGDVDLDRYNGTRVADLKIDPVVSRPTMTAPSRRLTRGSRARAAWKAVSDANGVIGYDARVLVSTPRSDRREATRLVTKTQELSLRTRLDPGRTYCLESRARDGAENISRWSAERCIATPVDDRALRPSSGWTRRTTGAAYRDTFTEGRARGSFLRFGGINARRVAVVALRCPRCGRIDLVWKGDVVRRVDLRSPSRRWAIVGRVSLDSLEHGTAKIVIASRRRRVAIDGLFASRS